MILTKSINRSNLQISGGRETNLLLFANKTSNIGSWQRNAGNMVSWFRLEIDKEKTFLRHMTEIF